MPSLRILGGSAKGRTLKVPDSARPTGARVRKSLFDLLDTRYGEGSFLDLYGGSGAVGLEAASRGYDVTLIEKNAAAVRTLERNARELGLPARVVPGDALALLPRLGSFDLVFVDPPYAHDLPRVTQEVLASGVSEAVIVQHPTQVELGEQPGYARERRVYGSNVLTLYTRLDV